MGEGLQRATMACLATQGPWRGNPWTLTGEELRAFWEAVPDWAKMLEAIGTNTLSDRKADRALQLLRKNGLIYYDKNDRTWKKAGT